MMTLAQWFEERELRRELRREWRKEWRKELKGDSAGKTGGKARIRPASSEKGMSREDVAEMANLPLAEIEN